jgi:dTDP-4-dehydrorhamnose 3,5-epimerase
MLFRELELGGAFAIELEPHRDERGFFARTWCRKEFAERNLFSDFVQCSLSFNIEAGTLRGLHYQLKPYVETKIVQCVRGAIYDVIVDLRPSSATYLHWIGLELRAPSRRMLYVPADFAHGFQTLEAETEVTYMISEFHRPQATTGIRYDDPSLAIEWPLPIARISARDTSWPLLK